jgi:hypothetical protein
MQMRYLIIANQTADSPQLSRALLEISRNDPDASFVLVVPATPLNHLLVWEEGETMAAAGRRADSAAATLKAAGVNVAAARVGDGDPVLAIADELLQRPGYAAVVIGTLPPGLSRWLKLDLLSRASRLFPGQRFLQIVASAGARSIQVSSASHP